MDFLGVFMMINMDFMSRRIRKLQLKGLWVNRRPVSFPFLSFGLAKIKSIIRRMEKTIVYSNR